MIAHRCRMPEFTVSAALFVLTVGLLVVSPSYTTTLPSGDDGPAGFETRPLDGPAGSASMVASVETSRDPAGGRNGPGTLEWKYDTPEGDPVSTPALVDLDGDDDLEVVFVSEGDAIYALSSAGSLAWKNTDSVIGSVMDCPYFISYEPPPFFSSVNFADVAGDSAPELFVGVMDGIVCLNPDGSEHWRRGATDGYYYSTPTVTDLEGEYTGVKSELEVVCTSDASNRTGWLEVFHPDGGTVFRKQLPFNFEGPQVTCSAVSTDLNGSFSDPDDPPGPGNDTWHELEVGYHDHGMKVFAYRGDQPGGEPDYGTVTPQNLCGHHTFSTAAVGNLSMANGNDPGDHEIVVGSCEGSQSTWSNWLGSVYCYDGDGTQLWRFQTGFIPSAVQSSPAVCDVQMVDFLGLDDVPVNEVFVGCDSGTFYCLNADNGSVTWSYATGGRIMSSPAICNIGSDDELEVVVGSDDGYIYCFDGDPSDKVDDGVADSGGTTGAYDILWKYNTQGGAVGISSPVVADIDGDDVLEVVIGNAAGSVFCIEAGPCNGGQIDWPRFHGDVNQTGYYRPVSRAGVHLGTDGPTVSDVLPDAWVDFNLAVRNDGTGAAVTDRIDVTVEPESADGWSAKLVDGLSDDGAGGKYVTLKNGVSASFTLRVFSPDEAVVGNSSAFTVTATSGFDPKVWKALQVTAILNCTFGADVGFTEPPVVLYDPTGAHLGERWKVITPGTDYTATLQVRNEGDLNDTFYLELTGVPPGWNPRFADGGTTGLTLELPAERFGGNGSGGEVKIIVSPPGLEAPGTLADVIVTATSVKSGYLLTPDDDSDIARASDTCKLEVDEISGVLLEVDEYVLTVDPGGGVTFHVNATSTGNAPIFLSLGLEGFVDGRDDGLWGVEFPLQLFLAAGATESFEVTLEAPADLWVGSTQELMLLCTDSSTDVLVAYANLSVLVSEVSRVTSDVEPLQHRADPGGKVTYGILLVNEGNDDEEVHLEITERPPGWSAALGPADWDAEGTEMDMPVEYRGEEGVSLEIEVPAGTPPGRYLTTVGLTAEGTVAPGILNVFTLVNQTYDVCISHVLEGVPSADDTIEIEGDPGSSLLMGVLVENLGTGQDNVTLEPGGPSGDWSCSVVALYRGTGADPVDIDPTPGVPLPVPPGQTSFLYRLDTNGEAPGTLLLGLAGGGSVYATLRVDMPRFAAISSLTAIDVNVRSSREETDVSNNRADFLLKVVASDLGFDPGPPAYENVADGSQLTVSATVVNLGTFTSRDTRVTLVVDGMPVEETPLPGLGPGVKHEVDLNWTVGPSRDDVWLVIDPDNGIVEADEGNNRLKVEVSAPPEDLPEDGESGKEGEGGDLMWVSFLLALILATVATAAFFILGRRRKNRENEREDGRAPLLAAEVEGTAVAGPAPAAMPSLPAVAGAVPPIKPLVPSPAIAVLGKPVPMAPGALPVGSPGLALPPGEDMVTGNTITPGTNSNMVPNDGISSQATNEGISLHVVNPQSTTQ